MTIYSTDLLDIKLFNQFHKKNGRASDSLPVIIMMIEQQQQKQHQQYSFLLVFQLIQYKYIQ